MGDGILGEKMRLDKLLALLGEGTRSEIKAMVRAGRVTVDGAGARDVCSSDLGTRACRWTECRATFGWTAGGFAIRPCAM